MRPFQMRKRYIAPAFLFSLLVTVGALFSDQLGPYIGYVLDSRYDEIIQKMLFNATVEYEKARALNPDSKVAHNNLGVIHRLKGELDKAEEEFKTAISKDENFSGAWMNLGVVYAGKGLIDEAIDAHQRALKNAPSIIQAQIRYNLGCLYDEADEYDKAIEEFEMVKSHKDAGIGLKAKAHVASGVSYAKQGDYDLAYDEFKTAISLAPNSEASIFAELNMKALPQKIERYIRSVSVTGSPARLGGTITVTVEGVQNAEVSFSIENVVSNVPMVQERQGVYVGRYVVSEAINVNNAPVIVKLIDPDSGKVRTDKSQSVVIDTVAKIDSVTITGSSERVGDVITVIVQGEPGSKVTFSIDGLVTSAPMVEQEEGKYVGSYTVKAGDNVRDANVTVYLTDRAGNSVTDQSKKVTVTSKEMVVSFLNRSQGDIKAGDVFQVDIVLEDCKDLFGFQMDISFDPKVLSVQEVIEGDHLKKGGVQTFWRSPDIDNEKGLIIGIACVRQGTKEGVTGGGTLASIRFMAKSPGTSPLTFSKVDFADPSARRIVGVKYQDSSLTVKGIIGDVNNDGVVNVNDIIAIIRHLGRSATDKPELDLNGDGIINIIDVAIASRYIGQRR